MQVSLECANCAAMAKSRRRDFSDQVWAILIAWGEVAAEVVDQPVCDDCYNELRDILIDRATEYEAALADPSSLQPSEPVVAQKKKTSTKKTASGKGEKVAKATKTKSTRCGVRKVSKLAS